MKRKNNVAKVKNVITCGVLATMVLAGSSMPAFATEAGGMGAHVNPVNADYQQSITIAQPTNESMVDFVKTLNMLTKEEKALLVEAENAKAPYYKQMNVLYDQIESKTAAIMKEANPIFDQIFAIRNVNKALWDKVDAHENEAQKAVGNDYVKFIELSDVMTKAEKDILIRDQIKINDLYKEVDAYYTKVAEATTDLETQLESVRSGIRSIDKKTDAIWDKVYGE